MGVRVIIPIPSDFVVLCRCSTPLPLAYMYIECAHYPQFYAPTWEFLRKMLLPLQFFSSIKLKVLGVGVVILLSPTQRNYNYFYQ